MRLLLVLAPCFLAVLTMTTTPDNHKETSPPSSINSTEVQSLKNEIPALQSRLDSLRNGQDWWNLWYMRLGASALIFGGALGIASWVFQKKAGNLGLDSRPIEASILKKSDRLRELQDRDAQYQIELAKGAAEKAHHEAEIEKFERVKLEASIAWRSLSIDQQKAIGDACAGTTSKPVSIRSYSLDSEGLVLALQIKAAIAHGKTPTNLNPASIMPLGGFRAGILITSSHTDGPEAEFASCLGRTLQEIGHLTRVTVSTNGTVGSPVDVLVGVKPISTADALPTDAK